jgi:hypothetical protein
MRNMCGVNDYALSALKLYTKSFISIGLTPYADEFYPFMAKICLMRILIRDYLN